jgi:predicted PurR-regulated permease PerM
MIESETPIPFYAKMALQFVAFLGLVFILYAGSNIIMPIVYAVLFAILLNPIVNFLTKRKINRVFAIAIAVSFAIFMVTAIFYIVSSRISMLVDNLPELEEKFNSSIQELQQWIAVKFGIRAASVAEWFGNAKSSIIENFAIGERLSSAGRTLVTVILLPAYLCMILYYKPLLLEFISRLFRYKDHTAVVEVLTGTKRIIQSYLSGLFLEMIIVAILNALGLLLLGVDYAVILGIIGAILNIIPYLGGIIGTALPMLIAFVTKDSVTAPLLVFALYMLIQFIDNNFIIPKIVASRVQLNALVSVIVVLLGGALWGVSGMFLSIPVTAILKVIFDHIEAMKPWGFLLGNTVPTSSRFSFTKSLIKV